MVEFMRNAAGNLHRIYVAKADSKVAYLPWQKQGLSYTASGCGDKIPTGYVVRYLNRWRRVYCTIHSNIGTCWLVYKGERVIVDSIEGYAI